MGPKRCKGVPGVGLSRRFELCPSVRAPCGPPCVLEMRSASATTVQPPSTAHCDASHTLHPIYRLGALSV
jgi:hypothetical protein